MKILILNKTIRTFQRFGEEENDAVEPTGPMILSGTSINIGYIAEFNFEGQKQFFVRVFGCGEQEYERDYFALIHEMEDKELLARVPVVKRTATRLFTSEGRKEVIRKLNTMHPETKWRSDENGFSKEGNKEIISDLIILDLLLDVFARQQVFDWKDFVDAEKLQDGDCRDCD